jgi:hypothetical protein
MAGVLAMFLVSTPTSPMANAYSCSSSSNTHNTGPAFQNSAVRGSSGSCSTSSSASNSAAQSSTGGAAEALAYGAGPNWQLAVSSWASQSAGQATTTASAGGGQSSCSSSSAGQTSLTEPPIPTASASAFSVSKSGSCP